MKLEVTDTLEGQMRLWWVKACHWEGIAPQSKFVVFSPENPHQAGYDQAAAALQESLNPKTEVKKYDCWKSDTCYVCSGGTGIPRYHAQLPWLPANEPLRHPGNRHRGAQQGASPEGIQS